MHDIISKVTDLPVTDTYNLCAGDGTYINNISSNCIIVVHGDFYYPIKIMYIHMYIRLHSYRNACMYIYTY